MAYKRWSCHSGYKLLCKLCQNLQPPAMGALFTVFGAADGWRRSSQKTLEIRYSRCNRIKHWVYLRCAGIRQAQYTDTWTCHLHSESRLTTHADFIPPHPSRPCYNPKTTPHLHHPHHRNPNTDTRPTLPLFLQGW